MGIDVNRVIAVDVLIGSALAGAAVIFNCLASSSLALHGLRCRAEGVPSAVFGGIGTSHRAASRSLDRASPSLHDRVRLLYLLERDRVVGV